MKITVVTERKQVKLQTLRLHHAFTGNVRDLDFCEVRLTGNRTQRRKLRAVELHPVVVVLMLVLKRLQYLWSIRHLIVCLLA